jgi:hypothetical protein
VSDASVWGIALCVAVSWGCSGDDPVELSITRNQAPEADCSLSQVGSGGAIESGVFDLAIGDRATYILSPVVENPGPEDIVVTRSRVDVVRNTDEGSDPLRFTCTDPTGCDEWDLETCADETDPSCPVVPARGRASFDVPALPRAVTGHFQTMMDRAVADGRRPPDFFVTTTVQLIGYADGREIIGPEFSYEIKLCLGCLVDFPEGTDDPTLPGPDCCGGGTPTPSCYSGQDEPIDCRLCVSTLPEICNMGRTSCRF